MTLELSCYALSTLENWFTAPTDVQYNQSGGLQSLISQNIYYKLSVDRDNIATITRVNKLSL